MTGCVTAYAVAAQAAIDATVAVLERTARELRRINEAHPVRQSIWTGERYFELPAAARLYEEARSLEQLIEERVSRIEA